MPKSKSAGVDSYDCFCFFIILFFLYSCELTTDAVVHACCCIWLQLFSYASQLFKSGEIRSSVNSNDRRFVKFVSNWNWNRAGFSAVVFFLGAVSRIFSQKSTVWARSIRSLFATVWKSLLSYAEILTQIKSREQTKRKKKHSGLLDT